MQYSYNRIRGQLSFLLSIFLINETVCFTATIFERKASIYRGSTKYSFPSSGSSYEFAVQELRAQLTSMKRQQLEPSNNLSPSTVPESKRSELESYIKKVVLNDKSQSVTLDSQDLVGKWRLILTTEKETLNSLPPQTRILLEILNEKRLNYILEFTERVFALKELLARSSYSITQGNVLTYQYEEIAANVFGMSLPTGLFGLLKGRCSSIYTVYFDDILWIEQGYNNQEYGEVYFNAYIRDD